MVPSADFEAIAREKVAYMRSALRSTTFAYLLAPNLCIPLFVDDVEPVLFWTWYALAMGFGLFRIAVSFGPGLALPPAKALRIITFTVAGVGLVWGAGWLLLVPELTLENRYIFLYIVTGTMFSAMFGYGVHGPAFLAVAVPTLAPAPLALFWPDSGFPWPFCVGILGLMATVYGISRRFERTFADTLRLRFENERIAAQLAQERDASIAANLAKSEFIATASHDLRQPMFAINLQLQSLARATLDPPVRKTFDLIRKSVTTLNAMFTELLDISRADAGVIEPQFETLDLAQALAAVMSHAEVQCTAKNLAFIADIAPLPVRSDAILLAQIVQNLLTNAVQNTERGSVTIRAERQGGDVEISVSDTGQGIPEIHRARMFDEFYRVPHARSEGDMPGLGLGLSIVRRLSALLGIFVRVESEVGNGTRFSLVLPAAKAVKRALPPPAARFAPGLAGLTIIVIDDDPLVRAAYGAALASDGVTVIESDGFDIASGHYPSSPPDFMIADFKLGASGSGDVAIARLRLHFRSAIPAIIVTADTAPEVLSTLGRTGLPVLFKPVSYSELRDAIMTAALTPPDQSGATSKDFGAEPLR